MKTLLSAILGLMATILLATSAVAQDGYRIRAGDTLSVEVVEDSSLNRDVLVLPDGSINFPFAGTLQARGLTPGQIEAQITQGIGSNFAVRPQVFVTVRSLVEPGEPLPERTISVFLIGEFAAPGEQEIAPGTTLLQALSLGGGFSDFAALRRVQLRRLNPHTGETTVYNFNYRGISDGGILRNDPTLAEGDVILVPERRLFE